MAEKKAFALRIDAQMLKALEKWAADEFRSINGQIEYLLREALLRAGRVKKQDNSAVAASEKQKNQDNINI